MGARIPKLLQYVIKSVQFLSRNYKSLKETIICVSYTGKKSVNTNCLLGLGYVVERLPNVHKSLGSTLASKNKIKTVSDWYRC
jgi:hypothetical protein